MKENEGAIFDEIKALEAQKAGAQDERESALFDAKLKTWTAFFHENAREPDDQVGPRHSALEI